MALDGIGGALCRVLRPAAPMPVSTASTVQAGGGTPLMLGDILNLGPGATPPTQPIATPTPIASPAAPAYVPTAPAQAAGSPLPLGSIYAASPPGTPVYPQGTPSAVNPTPWNNPNYPQAGNVATPMYTPTPVYTPQPTPPQAPAYYPQPAQPPAYTPSNLPWPFNGSGGQGVTPVVSAPIAPVGSSSFGSYVSSGIPVYQSSTIPVYTSH